MINLLTETKEEIEKHGQCPENIIFIGSEETGESCTWEEFKVMADREYLEEHGNQKIREDLIIVFSDKSRLYRYIYDDLGEWKFVSNFKMPEKPQKIETLFCVEDDEITLGFWELFKGWSVRSDKKGQA